MRAARRETIMPNYKADKSWERYKPRSATQARAYVIEECGELLAAIGKSQRWGLLSYNPELPESEQETNAAWVLREAADVQRALELWIVYRPELDAPVRVAESAEQMDCFDHTAFDTIGSMQRMLHDLVANDTHKLQRSVPWLRYKLARLELATKSEST